MIKKLIKRHVLPRIEKTKRHLKIFRNPVDTGFLAAFYDLNFFPVSYDMLYFAIAAQARALDYNLNKVIIYIIEGDNNGFRKEDPRYDSAYPSDIRRYVSTAILEQLPRLAPLVGRTAALITRDEYYRIRLLYKHYYTTLLCNNYDDELSEFHGIHQVRIQSHDAWRHHGPKLSFVSSNGAKKLIQEWLTARRINKPITITLRDRPWSTLRNSSNGGWSKIIKKIITLNIPLVIIPDTERVFDSEISEIKGAYLCIPASISTEIRLALYESSRMNFSVNNGPGTMLMFSNAPYRYFAQPDNEPETSSQLWNDIGLPVGSQLSINIKHQKIVWKSDTYENIMSELEEIINQR